MYKYLCDDITPQYVKKLNYDELDVLCKEIRDYLINTVSKSGGHLASNLGVVELTAAIHRSLNAPSDKIVWDVGHQSYVHKIMTGRYEKMDSLRSFGGLCGFCNPCESVYDSSFTGHASVSLSTALGMAQARKLTGEKYEVAAVIGDGAFTGGLAYEALNNIGNLKTKMLIVLNDNKMSIEKNVGAFSEFLARARTNPYYTASKKRVLGIMEKIPFGGEKIIKFLDKSKNRLKRMLTPDIFFEQMGITYLGPVNGHNIKDMEEIFKRALSLNEPVLVHVITKKGKGYTLAERLPQMYHGVSPFKKETGVSIEDKPSYSSVFGDKLCRLAEENKKLAVITPAMIHGSGLSGFYKKYPERLYDVGIAEGHAVTFAAGLAAGGAIPVVAIYSSFLQRGYDNIIHDVCIGNVHVVFAIDRAGIVPGDGATHQGLFDISFLTSVPNMVILAPSCHEELRKMLDYAVNVHNGPIAIRYPKGTETACFDNGDFVLSEANVITEGQDITIAAEGRMVSVASEAALILKRRGIIAEVIDVRTIKPIDYETVFKSAEKCGALLTVEENMRRGGMGEMLASYAAENGIKVKLSIKAVDDVFLPHGSAGALMKKYGFDSTQIADEAERMLKH